MIRHAHENDAFEICDIWNPIIENTVITFTTTPKTPDVIKHMIANQPVFIAEIDGQLAGFTTYAPFRSGPGYLKTMELSIMMGPEHRAQGLAADLLNTLKSRAKSDGIHSLIAGMAQSNQPAIKFHAKHQFHQVAHIPQVGWKFDAWHDLILMQYVLSQD